MLREKLTECGWRDDVKQRCRGEALMHTCRSCTHASLCASRCSATTLIISALQCLMHTHPLKSNPLPPSISLSSVFAEFIQQQGRDNVTADDVVRFVRPQVRRGHGTGLADAAGCGAAVNTAMLSICMIASAVQHAASGRGAVPESLWPARTTS